MPRIHISSDFLMTKEGEQLSNLRWVHDLLKRPVEEGVGVQPAPFLGYDASGEGFSRSEFFRLSDLQLDMQTLHAWFNTTDISKASRDYLGTFITPGDVVIGYELCKQTRTILSEMDITYIDTWLHPVRFMDDIMFAMGSNNAALNSELSNGQIDLRSMQLYADRLKIQSYKGWERKDPIIVDNSALFVGQTLNDKSVLKYGRFHSVLDFKAEIQKLSEHHNHVYYSRHPFLKSGDEAELEFIQSLPNTSITTIPTYKLITHPRVSCVAGLSSSVLTEARLMDKEVLQLMEGPFALKAFKDEDGYSTRMHDLVDPAFWSSICRKLPNNPFDISGQDAPRVRFFEGKDKLRDMLGFYWGYGDIDKTENMRAATIRSATASRVKQNGSVASKQSSGNLIAIKRKIDAADVVAFDIFDTLLERVIGSPSDLFDLMAPSLNNSIADFNGDFAALRKGSRKLAESAAHGEEVLLKDRYKAIALKAGLNDDDAEDLHAVEIAAERSVLRARWAGLELYNYAHTAGKRIILISDTFFEPEIIHSFLEQCGYSDHAEVYLSSELGKLKATGNIYGPVIQAENVDPGSILMIGDNRHSDISKAKDHGIQACHLPDKGLVVADAAPKLMRELRGITDPLTRSLTTGLVAHKYSQGPIEADAGFSKGEVSQLGYGVLGPMFAGFSQWILDTARDRGITDIYFLARDGEIAKRCYSAIAADGKPVPKARYIYASRRSTRVASIESEEDIARILDTSFSPISLQDLFRARFGIDVCDLPRSVLEKNGFDTARKVVRPEEDGDVLRLLLTDPLVKQAIFDNAQEERDELLRYYAEHDLHKGRDGRKIAFVDIGHSGTIQQSLCKLLDLEGTTGLYFTTFDGIQENLGNNAGLGYFASNLEADDRTHPYKRNLLMFETAFLNEDRSFIRMNGGQPLFLDSAEDETRSKLSHSLHGAVTEFCEDLAKLCNAFEIAIRLSPQDATATFLAYLEEPTAVDAAIFKGVGFENQYSGRVASWIIPEDANLPAIWKKGAEALQAKPAKKSNRSKVQKDYDIIFSREPDHIVHRLFSAGVELLLSQPKRLKFRTKRARFFNDSRSSLARMFGAVVYGGPEDD